MGIRADHLMSGSQSLGSLAIRPSKSLRSPVGYVVVLGTNEAQCCEFG